MALTSAASGNYLTSTGTFTTPTRWSFSFHFRSTHVPPASIEQCLGIVGAQDVAAFNWGHGNANFIQAVQNRRSTGTWDAAKLTSTLSADTWYIIGGRYDGTNVTAWLNGSQEATTASADPTSQTCNLRLFSNITSLGVAGGTIAFACFWNTNLTDGEMTALGRGWHPTLIRRANIINGSDLTRDINQYRSLGWTQTGSLSVANNPRIIMPRRRSIITAPAAAAAGFKAAWARNSNSVIISGARAA